MTFLEVTLLDGYKTLINAAHIVRFGPCTDTRGQHPGTCIALSVPTGLRGSHTIEVIETPEEVVRLLYGLGATFAVDPPS